MTENEVTIDGVRYVAVDNEGCFGCVGCSHNAVGMSLPLPECEASERTDGRDVIWQVAPSTPDELTALRELNRELVEALEKLVNEYESEIHDRYDGTSSLKSRLLETEAPRAIIAKARGEK